ncbi:MAG: hypothetical protein HUK24_08545 [Sphaerochaetaceae bacterium]|nr:hypothetical protein [Sphaerochaetaceae bacterium]
MEYNDNLYCFYVGKADENGLKRRIKGDHLSNNPKGSTLRQSIYSLKYGKYFSTEENKIRNKTYVENILLDCFIEWFPKEIQDVNSFEVSQINSYLRLFNLDKGELRDNLFLTNGRNAVMRKDLLNALTRARTTNVDDK